MISARIWLRSLASRLDSGSSIRKTFGLADDGAADGDTLALAAGQGLGLAVEVLRDVEDLGGLLDLAGRSPALGTFFSFREKAMFS